MTLSEVLSIISISAVIAGGLFSLFQWRHQVKINRAKYIIDMVKEIRNDKDLNEVIYLIEYGNFKYTSEFHDSEIEKKVDKTLSYYSYICYLYMKKIITKEEILLELYSIVRVLKNQEIQRYLSYFYNYASIAVTPFVKANSKKGIYDFYYLVKFGIKSNILNSDFFIKNI